jgi:hypothetical protein
MTMIIHYQVSNLKEEAIIAGLDVNGVLDKVRKIVFEVSEREGVPDEIIQANLGLIYQSLVQVLATMIALSGDRDEALRLMESTVYELMSNVTQHFKNNDIPFTVVPKSDLH